MAESGNVERLGVRPVPPRAVAPTPDPSDLEYMKALIVEGQKQTLQAVNQIAHISAQEAVQAALRAAHTTLVGTFQAIATILAVRLILLLAVLGGFALSVMVLQNPTAAGAWILGGFVVATIWPLVILDIAGRRKPGNAE